MSERLDAKTPVERDGKTYWTKCGSAFVKGDKITVLLDAVPVNGKLVLMPPYEEGNERSGRDDRF